MTHPLDELCLRPLEEVSDLLATRQINPVELAEAVLDRTERLQPALNAYITITAERALADAKAAWAEIAEGKHRGPLHGVPIAHKDLFDIAGVPTTGGMNFLRENIPAEDGTVVAKLRDGGAICTGKLNMHEAAFGTSSNNEHFGAVHNPWDLDRVPGGSSGGSGAAVAAGLAYMATGSDTGGSIRIPASECGVVGLMPTSGRVSLHGVLPLSWTLDHAGPLTRTVRDAAIVLQQIAGYDARDPESVKMAVPDYVAGIEEGAKRLRVGVPKQPMDAPLPEIEALYRKALHVLESAGATLVEIDTQPLLNFYRAMGPIILAEAAAAHAQWFPSRRDEYSKSVAETFDRAAMVTSAQHARAMRDLRIARAGAADATLEGVDVLALPTMLQPPPKIDESDTIASSAPRTALTAVFDVTGQPVITVPCGLIDGKLPTGISLIARRWDEPTLLRAARAYELARGPLPAPPV
jgi:aspartyl-tRNA(Asn)/glutamyl-tRNA(Gln) amidotransferase subunit A